MDAATMREILKKEYGINNEDEFIAAVEQSKGINIGSFVTPLVGRSDDCEDEKNTA